MLPFTVEQLLGAFVSYNKAIWPAQIFAYLLGGLPFALVFRKGKWSDQIIAGILAAMWAWTGIGYHLTFYGDQQDGPWFRRTVRRPGRSLRLCRPVPGPHGVQLHRGPDRMDRRRVRILAAALYPLLGLAMGHPSSELPMFGVTPCPVTIFTFGMLLLTGPAACDPVPWSLVGGSAAILLRVPRIGCSSQVGRLRGTDHPA